MMNKKLNKTIMFFFLATLVCLNFVMSNPTNSEIHNQKLSLSASKLLFIKKNDDYKVNLVNKIKITILKSKEVYNEYR